MEWTHLNVAHVSGVRESVHDVVDVEFDGGRVCALQRIARLAEEL